MSDIALSVVLSRDYLGLPPLEINDDVSYQCTPQFLGATVSWNRVTATSPYIDGALTISRTREMVQEQIAVDVWGRTSASLGLTNVKLKANMDALVDAFSQNDFTLTVTIDSAVYQYSAEAADYQLIWAGPRFMAKRGQVVLTMPRQPVPLVGTV